MKLATRKLVEALSIAYCSKCARLKHFCDFTPQKSRRNGLNAICHSCAAEKSRIQREKNPETRLKWRSQRLEIERSQSRARHAKSPSIGRAATAEWRRKNPDAVSRYKKLWSARPETKALWRQWSAKRRAITSLATPSWADQELIELIYAEAMHRGMEVDHVIPLNGKTVCGLHVFTNMQLLTRSQNASKGNKFRSG